MSRSKTGRRRTDVNTDVLLYEIDTVVVNDAQKKVMRNTTVGLSNDYLKFIFYFMLLAVPLYAITVSVLKHDWLMVIIDALIVPVGFIHGLLLIFGYVS